MPNVYQQQQLTSIPPGGAGGKGTWGSLTDQMYADSTTQDTHDPNYSSEDDDDVSSL